ncbi:MAG TPA: hypothetical protein VFY10_15075 [Dehalococcoidia bacterium]|nr:hypothetical protein [Dehalococcoidia bacterium]
MTLDGKFDAVIKLRDEMLARSEATGVRAGRAVAARAARRALIYLGMFEEALGSVPNSGTPISRSHVGFGQRAMCLAHMGHLDEARDILGQFKDLGDLGRSDDASPSGNLRYLLEAAILVEDKPLAQALSLRFQSMGTDLYAEANMVYCIGHLCGEASNLTGNSREARLHYVRALEVCERVRFRPEVALIRLDLAELLLEHYPDERDAAIEHLDFAITEFREMKMQPALERALRHRGC